MKNNKRKKKIIIVVALVILLAIGGFFLHQFLKNKRNNFENKSVEVLDEIKNYDYYLEDRDTEIYKETFFKLKDLLEKNTEINYKQYAEYLATLFLIDLYTIDNKFSKYDIGSLDFIYSKEQEKFQNKVMDTLYKMVLDNSTGTRKQELPVVTKIDITNLEISEYLKGETPLEAYLIHARITYQKDLGYDKEVSLTIAKEENKLYVVNLTSE